MSHVEITFKSGATVHADVSEWSTTKNKITHEVTGFEWVHDGPRRLQRITVEEVVAVVFVDDDSEGEAQS